MLPVPVILALAAGIGLVALLFFGAGALAGHTVGRLVLLVGLLALPLLLSAANFSYGVHQSSRTQFCLSCHEMQDHGKSLFVDSKQALAAFHYQNRLVDRDTVCYSCHKDYAMFGDVKAKLNGLRHVWAHYVTGVPKKIELYKPYPNSNCLHCHEDARSFVDAPAHRPVLGALSAGSISCLTCHRIAHDMAKVETDDFWQAR
ncbi:MAG TPA: NapC/NirT family cytochrome c [Polyangia bacterium]|nr:NapC/NirT family cytochrome c [Polyangia bacterium]